MVYIIFIVWAVYANRMCSRQWVWIVYISSDQTRACIYRYRCHAQICMHSLQSHRLTSHVTLSYLGSWVGARAHVCACDSKSMMTYSRALCVRWTSDWARVSQGKGRAESPYYASIMYVTAGQVCTGIHPIEKWLAITLHWYGLCALCLLCANGVGMWFNMHVTITESRQYVW